MRQSSENNFMSSMKTIRCSLTDFLVKISLKKETFRQGHLFVAVNCAEFRGTATSQKREFRGHFAAKFNEFRDNFAVEFTNFM